MVREVESRAVSLREDRNGKGGKEKRVFVGEVFFPRIQKGDQEEGVMEGGHAMRLWKGCYMCLSFFFSLHM